MWRIKDCMTTAHSKALALAAAAIAAFLFVFSVVLAPPAANLLALLR